jgi:hypothetical protein
LRFIPVAVVLALGASLTLTGAAHAEPVSLAPIDTNQTWYVDEDCEYALILWNDAKIQHWTESRPGRSTRLSISKVKLSRGSTNPCEEGHSLTGGQTDVFNAPIEIDADADGTYESTQSPPRVGHFRTGTFGRADAPYKVRARVVAPNGNVIVAQHLVYVQSASGVSIASGATFTNSRRVSLRLVPPPGATSVRIANDAGFRKGVKDIDLTPDVTDVDWTLAARGKSKQTRSVYVKYYSHKHVGTFSDDVILDVQPPVITDLRMRTSGKNLTLRIAAKDNRSGITMVQVARTKKARSAPVKYRKSLRVSRSKAILVRVQDGAGSWSAWRRLR